METSKLPPNWVFTNLGSILKLKNGYAFKSKDFIDEGIPVIRISNIRDEKIDLSKSAFVSESKILERFLIKKGDILIAMSGATTGKYGVYNSDNLALQNQRVGNFEVFSEKLINKTLIYYLIGRLKKEIEEKAYGGAQPNISSKLIEEIQFSLPPRPEQDRIVAKVDVLMAQIATMQKSLERIPQLLKDFRQQVLTQAVTGKLTEDWRKGKELNSYLTTITNNRKENYKKRIETAKINGDRKPKKLDESDFEFFNFDSSIKMPKSWKLANLKNIADLLTDGEHSTPRRTESGYYLLSARNVQDGFISLDKVDYVPEDEYSRIKKRCNPEYKDVLISCSGSVGRVSTVPKGLEFVMVRSAALVKLQSNKEISKFVELSLRSRLGQNQILTLQKSTAQSNLFLGQIGKIVVPIPSKEEQFEIVKRVEALFAKADTIETQYQTLKTKIDTLPQAILHKAFKGELVEQLPTDGDAKDLLREIEGLKTVKI